MSSLTPLTVITLFLTFMFAPQLIKNLMRSITSGSIAQFFNIDVPLAKVDAIKIFCVAPTLIFENECWMA